MKEKLCPICEQPIRSDALAKNYCKLCGMNIDTTKHERIDISVNGERQCFCCSKCMTTYIESIYQERSSY
ncbi:MAG: hypothetical protein NWE83_13940 [Candidatus Bathyarchaeota archaeon]|jgi:hypothetical protein|nr:hypothetical protein [Candidatus Bathyarchaeota archaeon]